MENREKKQKDATGEKYIHVSEIPIQKLDKDPDFKDDKNNQVTNPSLKEAKQPKAENNETMGIP
ncbi:hypothetical protein [Flavobacterium microcysteis]|uniref:Uncharacterized protein n=1 Tax=Flavobacterium microcysteis TaxID=2596891 RepID=A0A501Q3K9_9FLAO|nr:hypothetical protein [Flavobacterium microcysteis]TPD67263.1 hypothetical protein FJA49_13390 [Flavobacterium microcysteis]